jgi:HlyD family secretion protein
MRKGFPSIHEPACRGRAPVWPACVVFLLAVGLSACSQTGTPIPASPAVPADRKTAVVCLGRLVPGERVIQVAAPSGAILKTLQVVRGQRVGKGQILATLREDETARASLAQAQAEIALAEAQLAQVEAGEKPATIVAQQAAVARYEAELGKSLSEYQRTQKLYMKGVVPLANLEESRAAWESAGQRVREAQ